VYNGLVWPALLLALLLVLAAQVIIDSTYRKYARRFTALRIRRRSVSAWRLSELLLQQQGIYDVRVERVRGHLNDFYNVQLNQVRLSDSVRSSSSMAAWGWAAHKVGQVMQRYDKYFPFKLAQALDPVLLVGAYAALPLFLVGLGIGVDAVRWIGVELLVAVVGVALLLMPVEINAARRAMAALRRDDLLSDKEDLAMRRVLRAVCLTRVALPLRAAMRIVRFLLPPLKLIEAQYQYPAYVEEEDQEIMPIPIAQQLANWEEDAEAVAEAVARAIGKANDND
jgi:Zn-dependent membrane protease YugP